MLVGRLAQTLLIDAVRPWKDRSLGRLHGTGGGFRKRALRWMIQARKEGFDALVLLVDEDGDRNRFQQVTEAQEVPDLEVPRALGVAVRTFDAWMLADETALTRVLRRAVQTQPDPEGIAGPKEHMRELVGGSPGEDALRRVYADIARGLEIAVLERRCPRGFATFAKRVRALSP